jgi:hypothetical protein
MIKAVLPGMRARRAGTILNISSIAGRLAAPGSGYYSASKFAVEGMSDALRKEVGPLGIRVMIVEPGAFRTDFAGRSLQQAKASIGDYAATAGPRRKENDRRTAPSLATPSGRRERSSRSSAVPNCRSAFFLAVTPSRSSAPSSMRSGRRSCAGRTSASVRISPPRPDAEFLKQTQDWTVDMKTRRLGLEVSALGLGCMSMTSPTAAGGQGRDDQAHPRAHDRGVTLFDTAEAYGPFPTRNWSGEALAPIRDQVVIATKFGFDIDLETGERRGGTNSRPEHIKAVDRCLPEAPED